MSTSIKNILIDLQINNNFVKFLQFVKDNLIISLNEIDSNLSTHMSEDYTNMFGHSHSFQDIVQSTKNHFESFTSVDDYLNNRLTSLTGYSIWKPIFDRGINYTNEQSFLDTINTEFETIIPSLLQFITFFSLVWVDSPVTSFSDESDTFSISSDDSNLIQHDLYARGVVNFMSIRKKKHIYIAFCHFKNSIDAIFDHFQEIYQNITMKNSYLNSLRNLYTVLFQLLQKISLLTQNAKDELYYLTTETATASILESPALSVLFRENVKELAKEVKELGNTIESILIMM